MAVTSSAATGVPRVRIPGTESASSHWELFTPEATDVITWTMGANAADGATFAVATTSEVKFGVLPFGGLVKRTFRGAARADTGALGSIAASSGFGKSYPESGLIWQDYTIDWTVSAFGVLGQGPTGPRPGASYSAFADASDPLTLRRDAFDARGIAPGDRVDLMLPVAWRSLDLERGGSGGLRVGLATAAGRATLLDLRANDAGVSAAGDSPAGLSIYRVRSFADDPEGLALRPWRLADVEQASAALLDGGQLSRPLLLAFMLSDFEVPSQEMGAGVLAQFDVGTDARTAEAVPPNEQQQRIRRR